MGGTPDTAGPMSFLPKLSKLLETLFMLRGAAFVPEPDLEPDRTTYTRHTEKYKDVFADWIVPCFVHQVSSSCFVVVQVLLELVVYWTRIVLRKKRGKKY